MSTTPGIADLAIWYTVMPPPRLIDLGSADAPEVIGTTVVVVTDLLVVPLETASAIAPPAIAPPRIGRKRLAALMVLSWDL
jgi:hypothetical protein